MICLKGDRDQRTNCRLTYKATENIEYKFIDFFVQGIILPRVVRFDIGNLVFKLVNKFFLEGLSLLYRH